MQEQTEKKNKNIRELLWSDFMKGVYIAGLVIAVVNFISRPQQKTDLAVELLKAQVATQDQTINTVTKTQQNDTQEVKGEVKGLREEVGELQKQIVELRTIIDERIPKKK